MTGFTGIDGYPLPTVVVASEPKMTLKRVVVYQTCRKDRVPASRFYVFRWGLG